MDRPFLSYLMELDNAGLVFFYDLWTLIELLLISKFFILKLPISNCTSNGEHLISNLRFQTCLFELMISNSIIQIQAIDYKRPISFSKCRLQILRLQTNYFKRNFNFLLTFPIDIGWRLISGTQFCGFN